MTGGHGFPGSKVPTSAIPGKHRARARIADRDRGVDGITSLPGNLAGPRHLAIYARQHWGIENKERYT